MSPTQTFTITLEVSDPQVDRTAITYAINESGLGRVLSVALEVNDPNYDPDYEVQ